MIKYRYMEVYIEYVIIDNFIIDYLLLMLALKYSKENAKRGRVALSAAIGTVVALLMPIVNMPAIVKFFVKIALAFIMTRVCVKPQSTAAYFKTLGLFLLFTLIFGGSAMLIMNFCGITYDFFYGSSAFPLGISLVIAVTLYRALKKAFSVVFEKTLVYPFTRQCVLTCKNKKVEAKGLIDSGNHLIFNGDFAVCVPCKNLVKKMKQKGFFDEQSLGEMTFKTASGKSFLKIYEIDEMLIYCNGKSNIIKRPKIGIGVSSDSFGDDFEIILSAAYAQY
ncbi:MAG: sigma-E processing peptidase SpoIIGA [Candidatus Borkfalkiaceae bacterium]|nr:sigma-E processing peptidase SpoIIGA [Christensenellaceae bacterium]